VKEVEWQAVNLCAQSEKVLACNNSVVLYWLDMCADIIAVL